MKPLMGHGPLHPPPVIPAVQHHEEEAALLERLRTELPDEFITPWELLKKIEQRACLYRLTS